MLLDKNEIYEGSIPLRLNTSYIDRNKKIYPSWNEAYCISSILSNLYNEYGDFLK